ncbi:MAG TPA: rhodanese-like domain-containing protein [Anaeromyxobacter sp.]|nr:rhodanese-like domain-containing protein [Anaeromyxobacter sp.]
MTPLPFWSLLAEHREAGLVVSVLVGFAFGFVLERAGFGRAQKLVGQFLLTEMTVLKVMFGAVATAAVGSVVLAGVGLVDLRAVADSAASATWIWPMVVGGFVVGLGFVTSSYCPGTSVVAMASGKLDGAATVAGVVVGTVIGGELLAIPAVARFNDSGFLGHLYLHDLLRVPPAVVAMAIALVAVAAFVGAEKLERIFGGEQRPGSPARPRRAVFATLAGLGAAGLVTLALPRGTAAAPAAPARVSAAELARRVLEEPWKVRVLDVRPRDACAAARVPGAECTPLDTLASLYLAEVAPARDLVVVAASDLAALPAEVRAYRGKALALEGGFEAWKAYALAAPPPPAPGAGAAELEAWRLRAGLQAALTGAKAPPPPPVAGAAPVKRKAGGGGCSG